ncbi:organic solute transporter Ostalpha-domain-containing protein [Ganoderma leucocontextum]|nr:organic solute transporter Ostalpha-domain-containing protein [Ganoderma leucocontextum]
MVDTNSTLCPSDNLEVIDQSSFWDSNGLNWDAHRIGWLIAGACAAVTVILTVISVSFHCRNYTNPSEQRQIIRILYMPAVYAIISFFSYRFFHSYTYYDLIECVYESVTLSAFLLLLIEYVASTAVDHDVDHAILRKDKSSLPMPFCCWRYRPTKAYFMYTVKWSVLQYVILRPALSIAGIICEHYGVLCQSGPWSFRTAHAYFSVIDCISITIALYGLLLFYGLTKDELVGRKPLAKFLSIKLIVMFTFYQSFVFSALEGRVIHATQYWTATNIADGLNALAICIEMVIFSAFMMYAYTWKEYAITGRPKTSVGRPLLDSVNYSDFAHEIWGSLKFFVDYVRGKPGTHGARVTIMDANGNATVKKTYGEAFGFERSASGVSSLSSAGGSRIRGGGGGESMSMSAVRAPRESFEENVRLAPYTYAGSGNGSTAEGFGNLNGPSVENISAPRY